MTSKSDPLPHPSAPLRPPPTPPSTPPSYFNKPSLSSDIESAASSTPRRRHPLIPGFYTRPLFCTFLRTNGYDIATQLVCVGIAFALYKLCPPLMPRYFPYYPSIERTNWGMAHSRPCLPEYVTTVVSAVVSFAVPAAVMGAVALWGTRRFEDGDAALMGLGYALATATLFQAFIKIFVGGLRPHFLTVCVPNLQPNTTSVSSTPKSTLQYYEAKHLCTGNKSRIREAQMSFPSGHACAAFAGFGFLALWLNAKFKVLSRGSHFRDQYGSSRHRERAQEQRGLGRRVHHWKLVLFVAPWCIAALFALSKVSDAWHHPIDVAVGAMVGTFFAHMAYKMAYWSVYDWRTNHIPLGASEDQMETVNEKKI